MHQKSVIRWLQTVLLLVPLACGAATTSAAAVTSPATASAVVDRSGQIGSLAASALAFVVQGRSAIQQKKLPEAIDALSRARTLVDLIAATRPAGEVLALLSYFKTDLGGKSNLQALPDLLLLYRGLDSLGDYPGAAQARLELDKAKHALEDTQRGEALAALHAMEQHLRNDRIDLPLAAAQDDMTQVLGALAEKHAVDEARLTSLETNLRILVQNAAPSGSS